MDSIPDWFAAIIIPVLWGAAAYLYYIKDHNG